MLLPQSIPEERRVRILEIREQIAEGTYETPEKLAIAIDAFLRSLEPPSPPANWRPNRPR